MLVGTLASLCFRPLFSGANPLSKTSSSTSHKTERLLAVAPPSSTSSGKEKKSSASSLVAPTPPASSHLETAPPAPAPLAARLAAFLPELAAANAALAAAPPGSDFDIEGFQFIGDHIWIGDEFGPYVLKTDKTGKVLAMFETLADGKPVRSPDHWQVASPGAPGLTYTNVNLRRSKGFEGFASSKDGKFIYGLLEGPVFDADKKDWERIDGKEASRILEFDVAAEKWTGRFWLYPFEANGNAIGDFNMIDASTGLVIERDNGEGTADKACAAGVRGTDCFPDIAKFKRVYKIELNDANVGKPVRKIAYIDLMKIQDPAKKARKPLNDGVLTFPFFTIENVDVVDDKHIVVGNDNNLPFSSSRMPNVADDNELVLLEVEALLKAK